MDNKHTIPGPYRKTKQCHTGVASTNTTNRRQRTIRPQKEKNRLSYPNFHYLTPRNQGTEGVQTEGVQTEGVQTEGVQKGHGCRRSTEEVIQMGYRRVQRGTEGVWYTRGK